MSEKFLFKIEIPHSKSFRMVLEINRMERTTRNYSLLLSGRFENLLEPEDEGDRCHDHRDQKVFQYFRSETIKSFAFRPNDFRPDHLLHVCMLACWLGMLGELLRSMSMLYFCFNKCNNP